jgi:hypothetical protein
MRVVTSMLMNSIQKHVKKTECTTYTKILLGAIFPFGIIADLYIEGTSNNKSQLLDKYLNPNDKIIYIIGKAKRKFGICLIV